MNHLSAQILVCLSLVSFAGCRATSLSQGLPPGLSETPRLAPYSSEICLDSKTGLMWFAPRSSETFGSWRQAYSHVDSLKTGGFEDWRLPTHEEFYILRRLVDRDKAVSCSLELKGSHWTGVGERTGQAGFWDVEPLCGGPSYFFVKQSTGAVIAVRSAWEPP